MDIFALKLKILPPAYAVLSIKKGRCSGSLESNLCRQYSSGYELYYPVQKFINKLANTLMISTQDVLKVLLEEYGTKIDRTVLFKYNSKGLIKKEQKIARGRGKGVKTYWDDNTPLKIFAIKKIISQGLTLDEVIKYHDILYKFENVQLLEYYRPKAAIINDKIFKIDSKESILSLPSLEVAKFHIATYYFAVCEADLKHAFEKPINPSLYLGYIVDIGYDRDDPGRSFVEAYIYNKDRTNWEKKVVFRKEGPKVINFS